jgi:hypothetical protein
MIKINQAGGFSQNQAKNVNHIAKYIK